MAATSMKDIKLRIKSVESTMQITKAMQLVATSKLRRAKERMELSRPYADIARQAVLTASISCDDPSVPYLKKQDDKKACYIIIAGERGLAGGYNNNLFKAQLAHAEGREYCVLPIGRKAIEKYTRVGVPLLSDEYAGVEGLSVSRCYRIAGMLLDQFREGAFGDLYLVYTSFKTMMSQEVEIVQLLPVLPEEGLKKEKPVSTVYDPGAQEVLEKIMPDYLAGTLYSAVCNSFLSEVASRRSAMDSATKNAGEMIGELKLRFNRARQGAITQEITEIVAGAEQ
ncbi:MAG: ATP synthase F1 subunit gamma [Clostridia bacterium]|nr:ATP synthase F1 subunit gamma [Clostridia bacterium]